MYRYSLVDKTLVRQRVEQFRDQLDRYLDGSLDEEAFKPLRLMNGLYIQRHAPMLRVAIPYGTLSSDQLRTLAAIARRYDRGYGHFTTRQNIQYNWPALERCADILEVLAEADLHAIQTSGNCIRNITCDPWAGIHPQEVDDPRVYCELVRQWATLHPEFAFLPRKFKIAVTAEGRDRVALRFHDIGLKLVEGGAGRGPVFEIWVGGGLGRTPVVGQRLYDAVPVRDLLRYLDAILRVYNLHGRRDNKYKARIKILVQQMGIEAFRREVEEELRYNSSPGLELTAERIDAVRDRFVYPEYGAVDADPVRLLPEQEQAAYRRWQDRCVDGHRHPGFAAVHVSLKAPGRAPGDMTAEQMDAMADLADRYSFGEVRTTPQQNLMLPHVARSRLPALWRDLAALELATPNIGLATDMVVCPGLDFCSLANAASIPVAAAISARIQPLLDEHPDLGELKIHLSGCMNACAHHHIGHIGILGVDKKGREFYQITLGGDASVEHSGTGSILGPAIARDELPERIERLLLCFLQQRIGDERFVDTCRRIGMEPFKEATYAAAA